MSLGPTAQLQDPAWGRVIEALAKMDPAAAAQAAVLRAQRTGTFTHLDTPEVRRQTLGWRQSQASRRSV
jgi:hypothetical protein